MTGFEQALLYFVGFVLTVAVGVLLIRWGSKPRSFDLTDDTMVVLIGDGDIVDANFQARRVIEQTQGGQGEIECLQLFLSKHFDDASRLLTLEASEGDLLMQSHDGQLQAIRQIAGTLIRSKILFVKDGMPSTIDVHTLRAIDSELQTLRANTAAAPFLVWRQRPDGEITWVNKAYLDAAYDLMGAQPGSWPLPVIFPPLKNVSDLKTSKSRRIAVAETEDRPAAWYDCQMSCVGDDTLFTAVPADEAVLAENRRREFTQTLTKTFAELAIGLAIFDRSRRLVLFNPALLDLTNLPTDFLASRPSLVGFLDRLRENRVMPEPRDYHTWRTAIADLEEAASDGTYSDTWSLPDGQTYHVSGRPHPDGAVALLFEDISAEMSLTRHFRSELEQFQAVIDTIDDAVAMFSPSGDIAILNEAYRKLWSLSDDEFTSDDLLNATGRWHELTAPTPVWGDFREFARKSTDREEWMAQVAMRDGRTLSRRFVPRRGGITMAIFRVESQETSALLKTAI